MLIAEKRLEIANSTLLLTHKPHLTVVEKELVIHSTATGVEIALLEGGKLVELHHQKTNNNFSVGDIFIGKIRKLMPGLNAAFVDIGHRKDSFLHYTDLGPRLRSLIKWTNGVVNGQINTHRLENFKFEEEIIKTGKIDQVLNKRFPVLVQILKEPISTKGPRLSCELTLPGRYMVLSPFTEVISVSKKIASAEERKRLQTLAESIRPKGFGLIIRTAAEGKKVAELHEELLELMGKWEEIFRQLKIVQPPAKLLSELDKPASVLRDLLSDSFHRITVDDKELAQSIKAYLMNFSPDHAKMVQLHTGNKPVFEMAGVTKQVRASFGKTATMPSGAYIVIEKTEAMHVIDVNSGHRGVNQNDTEAAIFAVNLEAAEETSRQIRLRDIGGLITIDFIDMKNPENKKAIFKAMEDFMRKDRAQHTILPLSKFGLMQITRERARPEVMLDTAEVCPTCGGSGKVNATILLSDDIVRDLEFILQSRPKGKLVLRVHPYLEAYLKRGFPSRQMRWLMQFHKWVNIEAQDDYQLNDYRFFDGNEDEIRLSGGG